MLRRRVIQTRKALNKKILLISRRLRVMKAIWTDLIENFWIHLTWLGKIPKRSRDDCLMSFRKLCRRLGEISSRHCNMEIKGRIRRAIRPREVPLRSQEGRKIEIGRAWSKSRRWGEVMAISLMTPTLMKTLSLLLASTRLLIGMKGPGSLDWLSQRKFLTLNWLRLRADTRKGKKMPREPLKGWASELKGRNQGLISQTTLLAKLPLHQPWLKKSSWQHFNPTTSHLSFTTHWSFNPKPHP